MKFYIKRPMHPLPKVAYEKGKSFLHNHRTFHFFLHNTYCRITLNYDYIPYSTFDLSK